MRVKSTKVAAVYRSRFYIFAILKIVLDFFVLIVAELIAKGKDNKGIRTPQFTRDPVASSQD
jgi:hypothetical protein